MRKAGETNRKERRARARQARQSRLASDSEIASPHADSGTRYEAAFAHYRRGEFAQAERLCQDILAQAPDHLRSLALLGDMAQQSGRNKLAVKLLGRALALDPCDVAARDSIAMACHALGRGDEAVRHFALAMASGLSDAEALVKQSAAVAAPLRRLTEAWPRRLTLAALLGDDGAGALGNDSQLLALLRSRPVGERELEQLLTAVRRALLDHVAAGESNEVTPEALRFYGALAEQCFINDYVFALDEGERERIRQIQQRIAGALQAGAAIAPIDVIVFAAFAPLHAFAGASGLLLRQWPDPVSRLLVQQIREPAQEEAERAAIPVLTPMYGDVSAEVRRQYEENPYPRWVLAPPVKPLAIADHLCGALGVEPARGSEPITDVLIAGCGTGAHSIDAARRLPQARILALDLSRASLAYASRKTRELGLTNIEYGQADILNLASLGRGFDLIEAVGVLHHLDDPAEGWRVLLSLLRPGGLMFVGLYSALARRSVTAARALIAEAGYKPTADDIRRCRQDLIRRGRVPPFSDFSSLSSCRDLLFHVMEHQFTIPRIAEFLDAQRLTFLGFDRLPPGVAAEFRQQFPEPDAPRHLERWHRFEATQPMTFGNMYLFWLQKP